jgi:glycosyltransferase involved in cell wall biosynthesis
MTAILGLVGSFDELAAPDRRIGRLVASHGLVAALLEHSTFAELHVFLPFARARRLFEERYRPDERRVKLLLAEELPAALRRSDYSALHAAEHDRFFVELCHLRGARPIPVTCVPHTLNAWATQVHNLYKVLPGPRPSDSIVCTSAAARDCFRRALDAAAAALRTQGFAEAGYRGRLDVVPLGVRSADFTPADRGRAQEALGLLPGPPTLLCLGRLTPYSKHDLAPLVAALSLLGSSSARLVLAGAEAPGYSQTLVEAARALGVAERLHVVRDFDSAMKPTLLAAADVFVSPVDNLQETFGLAVVEAMAAGLPVVASDWSGYRDLVVDGETGFLVPTTVPERSALDAAWPFLGDGLLGLATGQRTAVDLGVLVARLDRLVADAELRRRMGAAGRRRAVERFDWAVVVRALEALWAELGRVARAVHPGPLAQDALGAGLRAMFASWPTRTLAPDAPLVLGPLAERVWPPMVLADAAASLSIEQVRAIMDEIRRRGGRATVAELADVGHGRADVEDHIVWGLKYGLLAFDS